MVGLQELPGGNIFHSVMQIKHLLLLLHSAFVMPDARRRAGQSKRHRPTQERL